MDAELNPTIRQAVARDIARIGSSSSSTWMSVDRRSQSRLPNKMVGLA